ncbi:MAG: Na+/H+ antiporter subunit E [Candidatus Diapherotrites archaeon]|nr:Na+/H+ antiporter subunit E [Candidatus Diapherotrites archaeon]
MKNFKTPGEILKFFVFFYLLSLAFWLFLTAFSGNIILWSAESLILGPIFSLFPSLIANLILMRLDINFQLKYLNPFRWFVFCVYVLGPFLFALIKANLTVAYIVITGKTKTAIVEIEPKLKNSIALVLLGNSITLTPGTLTLDERNGKLYIHCLNSKGPKPKIEDVCGNFHKWIRRIAS